MFKSPPKGIFDAGMFASMFGPGNDGDFLQYIVDGRAQNDADAAAVISACSLSAGAQQNAAYFLIGGLKYYGLWAKMLAVYGLAGGTAARHAINWKTALSSPGTYDITWNGSITHNSNGATGDGLTGYGNTGLAPSVIGQNSIHLSMYRRTAGGSTEYTMGASEPPTKNTYISARSTGNNQGNLNDNNGYSASGFLSTGFFLESRILSTSWSAFNGARKTRIVASTTTAPTTLPISIFGLNSSGTILGFSSTNLAFASIGSGLTDTEAASLSAVVQAYQGILGRAV